MKGSADSPFSIRGLETALKSERALQMTEEAPALGHIGIDVRNNENLIVEPGSPGHRVEGTGRSNGYPVSLGNPVDPVCPDRPRH